jgi:hypothetical protein
MTPSIFVWIGDLLTNCWRSIGMTTGVEDHRCMDERQPWHRIALSLPTELLLSSSRARRPSRTGRIWHRARSNVRRAIRRWQNLTGRDAVRALDGEHFHEIEAETEQTSVDAASAAHDLSNSSLPADLMNFHPVLRGTLKLSQPQLSRSGPDGQTIESSQLEIVGFERQKLRLRLARSALAPGSRNPYSHCVRPA